MAYAVTRAVTAVTLLKRTGDALTRLQAQLVDSLAGYMHQSVIMCSPAVAVLVVAGRMLWSGEAGEVAHHAALDNAYTAFAYHLFPIGSLCLNFLLLVQGYSRQGHRVRVSLHACMHYMHDFDVVTSRHDRGRIIKRSIRPSAHVIRFISWLSQDSRPILHPASQQ